MADPLARAAALADTSHLPPFEGKQVVAVGVEIPGAAGGLRDPMRIDPQAWEQGDIVDILFRCKVQKIRHDPIVRDEPEGVQKRVHVLTPMLAVPVDSDLGQDALDTMQKRLVEAREQAGVGEIPGQLGAWGDEDEALAAAHEEGHHADGLVEGCPVCQAEVDAGEDEPDG